MAFAGLDEGRRAVLAHQQHMAAAVSDDRSHDPDRFAAHFNVFSNNFKIRLYWSSQESARV